MAKKIASEIILSTLAKYKDMGLTDIDLRTVTDKKLSNNSKFRRGVLRKLNKLSSFKDYTSVKLDSVEIAKSVATRTDAKVSRKSKSTVYYESQIKNREYSKTTATSKNTVIGKRLVDSDGTITTSREVKLLGKDGKVTKDYQVSVSLPLDFNSATDIYSFLEIYRQAEERGELKGKAFRASVFGDNTRNTFTSISDMIRTMSEYKSLNDVMHDTEKSVLEKFIKNFELIEYSSFEDGYNAAKLQAQAKDLMSKKLQKVRERGNK
jgi:hypothetical protein